MHRIIISLESPLDDPSRVTLRVSPAVSTLLTDESSASDAALIMLDALQERFAPENIASAELDQLSIRTS